MPKATSPTTGLLAAIEGRGGTDLLEDEPLEGLAGGLLGDQSQGNEVGIGVRDLLSGLEDDGFAERPTFMTAAFPRFEEGSVAPATAPLGDIKQ